MGYNTFRAKRKRGKTQKGLARYIDEGSVIVAQKGGKEKEAYRPQIMSQPNVADPGWAGGPQLQALGQDRVAEVVQGVTTCLSLRDGSVDTANIPEGPAGGTLRDSPWRLVDAILRISSAIGFLAPLVEVDTHIRGRNGKALLDCGSTGNYISDSLVLALRMEVVPEKDFKVLELANKTTVKAQGYASF